MEERGRCCEYVSVADTCPIHDMRIGYFLLFVHVLLWLRRNIVIRNIFATINAGANLNVFLLLLLSANTYVEKWNLDRR